MVPPSTRPTRQAAPATRQPARHGPRSLRRAALIGALAGVLVATHPAPLSGPGPNTHQATWAGAGEAETSGATEATVETGPNRGSLLDIGDPSSTLLAELNVLAVSGGGVERAEQGVRAVLADIDAAHRAADVARQDEQRALAAASELDVESAGLVAARLAAVTARDRARDDAAAAAIVVAAHGARLDAAGAVLEAVAVQAYVTGNVADRKEVTAPHQLAEVGPGKRRTTYLEEVAAGQRMIREAEQNAMGVARTARQAALERASDHDQQRLAIEAAQSVNRAEVGRNDAVLLTARQQQRDALALAEQLVRALTEAKVALAEARRTATVRGSDLPLVVLDALVRAERRHRVDHPDCHLSWSLLAAVSRVESGHGDVGLGVDPLGATPTILGPRLAPETGGDVAVVLDSDGGALDGDPLYDRAVGPMQFIPSSWQLYGRDGNGDGLADPHNYYDAALAAGEHLCRAGHDTATAVGRRAAVLGYNHSESYQRLVSDLADRYAELTV